MLKVLHIPRWLPIYQRTESLPGASDEQAWPPSLLCQDRYFADRFLLLRIALGEQIKPARGRMVSTSPSLISLDIPFVPAVR